MGVICFLVILGWVTVFFGSLIREKNIFRQVGQVLCVALVTEVLNKHTKKEYPYLKGKGLLYLPLAINSLFRSDLWFKSRPVGISVF